MTSKDPMICTGNTPFQAVSDQDDTHKDSKEFRVLLAALACIQNSLLGGLLYGWASFDTVLTHPKDQGGAGLTLPQSTFIFSFASCAGMVASLLSGIVLDAHGPKWCSALSHLTIGLGCCIFSVCSTFRGFLLATSLVAFGGPGIPLSIVSVANLFPQNKFTVLAMLNGTISISFSILGMFAWLWKHSQISYQSQFTCVAAVVLASFVASMYCWPNQSFEQPSQTDVTDESLNTVKDGYTKASTGHPHILEQPLDSFLREDDSFHILEHHESFILSKKALESGMPHLVSLKDAPFAQQFFSGPYIRANVYFVIGCFYANFYVASITTELADENQFSTEMQDSLTMCFTFFLAGGFFASYAIGVVMDAAGVEIATGITILMGLSHSLILVFASNSRPLMVMSFCIYVLFRQFLFPVGIALITARLGFKFFGLLNGFTFVLSGLLQLTMFPLVKTVKGTCSRYNTDDVPLLYSDTCDHGRWIELHVAEVAVFAILLLVPFFDHRGKEQYKAKVREIVKLHASWKQDGGASSTRLLDSSSQSSFPSPYASPALKNYASIRSNERIGPDEDNLTF